MGTPSVSNTLQRRMPILLAIGLGLLLTAMSIGIARAGANCTVSVDPATVPVGGQYVVSGNFGGAEVHIVRGENVAPPEDSEPVVTTPQGQDSFSVTITAGPGSEGIWTVWGLIPATECGDSALVTVTAVPDTATGTSGSPLASAIGVVLLALGVLSLPHAAAMRRRSS